MDPRAIACRFEKDSRCPLVIAKPRFSTKGDPVLCPLAEFYIDSGSSISVIGARAVPPGLDLQKFLKSVHIHEFRPLNGFTGTATCAVIDVMLTLPGLDEQVYTVMTRAAFAPNVSTYSVIGINTLEFFDFRLCLPNDTLELSAMQYIAEVT